MAKRPVTKRKAVAWTGRRVWRGNADLKPLLAPIGSLKLDPQNARLHPERNQQSIRKSLESFGQQKPVVVDSKGFVRAGNGTLEQAKAMGWTHLACTRSNLPDAQLKAYAIADNTSGDFATWDPDVLREQLDELREDDFDLEAAGLDLSADDLDELIGDVDEEPENAQNHQPVAPETQPRLDQRKPIECPHCGKAFTPGRD